MSVAGPRRSFLSSPACTGPTSVGLSAARGMRADAMLEQGDLDGCAVWQRVLRAVGELQRAEPEPGAMVH